MIKQKREFSKWLLVQESTLIWIISLTFLIITFYCISNDYLGSLPWLAAMIGFPWSAYGVSQVYYYKKSQAENTKDGIKYNAVITELEKTASAYQDSAALEYDFNLDINALEIPVEEDPDEYQI